MGLWAFKDLSANNLARFRVPFRLLEDPILTISTSCSLLHCNLRIRHPESQGIYPDQS
jgi:hypothetical protein